MVKENSNKKEKPLSEKEKNLFDTKRKKLLNQEITPRREWYIKQYKEKYLQFKTTPAIQEKFNNPKKIASTVRKYCSDMIPPADIFHRLQHYYDTNYEDLKEIVNDLYCTKPDLETAINPYSWHEDVDEADEFIDKHKDEVITAIFKAHSGMWNIFAPYKKVRESMRYFNKKTQVLEEIAKQIERDAKLGADLMKKRIKVKKLKNIEESGPDSDAFLKWKEKNSTIKDLGGETLNEKDYASLECPEDAIEVPVFRMSDGGQKLTKSSIFTQAEAVTEVNGKDLDSGPANNLQE